jgi:hypothetical protein
MTVRRDAKSAGITDNFSTHKERKIYETRHALSKQPRKLSGELQTGSNHSDPAGTNVESGIPFFARQSATEVHMNAPEDCGCAEANNGDSAGQPTASETGGDDLCPPAAPPDDKSSDLLKAMYYWVLSRF